jgi:hypothetical protein
MPQAVLTMSIRPVTRTISRRDKAEHRWSEDGQGSGKTCKYRAICEKDQVLIVWKYRLDPYALTPMPCDPYALRKVDEVHVDEDHKRRTEYNFAHGVPLYMAAS